MKNPFEIKDWGWDGRKQDHIHEPQIVLISLGWQHHGVDWDTTVYNKKTK